jgi:hypothetical protein
MTLKIRRRLFSANGERDCVYLKSSRISRGALTRGIVSGVHAAGNERKIRRFVNILAPPPGGVLFLPVRLEELLQHCKIIIKFPIDRRIFRIV